MRLYPSLYQIIIPLFIMLCQASFVTDTASVVCEKEGKESKVVSVATLSLRKSLFDECYLYTKLSLLGEDTFSTEGLDYESVNWLLRVSELHMCVSVEYTNVDSFDGVTETFKGRCKGPTLQIINNPYLTDFTVTPFFVDAIKEKPGALRIRGNKRLGEIWLKKIYVWNEEVNGSWDLQPLGECDLPKPFTSFETLDRSCKMFYGRVVLEKEKEEIQYNAVKVHDFKLEGCIQIEDTKLKDITFLMAFTNFKPIPLCSQYIRNNENLCSNNLNYLNVFFKSIEFYNNSQHCSECIGGEVSEYYLNESANCSHIYGDLIIANLRGLPPNIDNLLGIEIIEGRLIIVNNTGLNKFDKLASLKSVGDKADDDVVIIVEHNADLTSFPLPKIVNITLGSNDSRVQLLNNPAFFEDVENAAIKEMTTEDEEIEMMEQVTIAGNDRAHIKKSGGNAAFQPILWQAVAILLLLLFCTPGMALEYRKKKDKAIPQPPYIIGLESQEQLTSNCVSEDVSEENDTHPVVYNDIYKAKSSTLRSRCLKQF